MLMLTVVSALLMSTVIARIVMTIHCSVIVSVVLVVVAKHDGRRRH